ncbi:hypothetical protein ACQR2L_19200 (plasmid) [Clostridium butyricum]|uniref:hypothetical protein n=1 Tax=Clostridium butyricum TaxID=1492 RepID=UPI003D12DFC4
MIKRRKNEMKRLMKSNAMVEGKHKGKIQAAEWIKTKRGKDAIKFTLRDKQGRTVTVIVVPGNIHGNRIIDTILTIYGEDDADLDDLRGMELIFEIEMNGDFYNLKNVYELEEDGDEEVLEDDEELEDEDLLDQLEEDEEDEEEFEDDLED